MVQGKITAKQEEILEYIKDCILKKGYPPSVREICEAGGYPLFKISDLIKSSISFCFADILSFAIIHPPEFNLFN